VTDDRKEDTDFNYWLNVVNCWVKSPLLIVQNEKQDRRRDISLGALPGTLPNLRDASGSTSPTTAASGWSAPSATELEALKHIRTPLPSYWRQVRETLERRSEPHRPGRIPGRLPEHFFERPSKLLLGGYLHDLGICLHYQDDPVLHNTVILKPRWEPTRPIDCWTIPVKERRGVSAKRTWRASGQAALHHMRHELLRS
jgi:hypothetical protein